MLAWSYPAVLSPEAADEIVVSFRDWPEALTSGADDAEARVQAADALEEAVLGRLARGEPIPAPRPSLSGEIDVLLDPVTAARAALASAMREGRVTNVALAARLNKTEGAVRRLVDGRTAVKMDSVLAALRALGREVALQVG